MLPAMALSMSASLGLAVAASSALADMTWPDWQYPHCGTLSASQAAWTFLPAGVAPMASMVVTRLPTAAETGVMHERVGCPSIWIVHAPHRPSFAGRAKGHRTARSRLSRPSERTPAPFVRYRYRRRPK